jgi:hypothetical protein
MTKKEQYEAIVTELTNELDSNTLDKVLKVLDNYIKPKNRTYTDDYAIRNNENIVTHIICKLSRVKLPATTEYFNTTNTGGVVIDSNTRLDISSKQAKDILAKHNKYLKETNRRLVHEFTSSGNKDSAKLKEELTNTLISVPDYSSVKE